ncbi:hypothetical protein [Anaerobranca gottschalkii]|uniref:Uncharacterized protein n=1 Tax=Anaerobranca gottschalkii DSM 13577 TaxID=1120990 RepID=A0A1H9YB99_9FIRM|nr:hypothetical protein [Anaerobranca gottschalkii]SES66090.1 hypothetical protein SAMN03080614_100272 [Anaerobranca gottschalkii DSM 13577]
MESQLKRKLEMRLRERSLKYNFEKDEEDGMFTSILGSSFCWLLCIAIGLFIYMNSFLYNDFSQWLISKITVYIDGSKDINLYDSIVSWLSNFKNN